MRKLLIATILLTSSLAYSMGRTDDEAIKPQLDELTNSGYACERDHSASGYMSQVAPFGKYMVNYNCTKEGAPAKNYVITYEVDGNQYAKCRNITAVSMAQAAAPSEARTPANVNTKSKKSKVKKTIKK